MVMSPHALTPNAATLGPRTKESLRRGSGNQQERSIAAHRFQRFQATCSQPGAGTAQRTTMEPFWEPVLGNHRNCSIWREQWLSHGTGLNADRESSHPAVTGHTLFCKDLASAS